MDNEGVDALPLSGVPVAFSHGDVNPSAFAPTHTALEAFLEGFRSGGPQAYTEYLGDIQIREKLAIDLGHFTQRPLSAIICGTGIFPFIEQAFITLTNLQAAANASGLSLRDAVKKNVFLKDMSLRKNLICCMPGLYPTHRQP